MIELNTNEVRVIGCLIEKSIVTPDQYPLTLNALTNACNQKSSRDPVMSLDQGAVLRTLRDLEQKNVVRTEENFKGRTAKYLHRFCNSRYSDLQFDDAELAIVCLLLLRGPQTPGELRARSGRLHTFDSNDDVVAALHRLMDRDSDPLVVRLAKRAGRRDFEYMHLFAGPIEETVEPTRVAPTPSALESDPNPIDKRVAALEADVAELKVALRDLLRR